MAFHYYPVVSGGGGGSIDLVHIFHDLTSQEVTQKKFNLPSLPADNGKVIAIVQGGSSMRHQVDYNISGLEFSWAGGNYDGTLETGDCIELFYPKLS